MMWNFRYSTTTEIRTALANARAKVENSISAARAFSAFSGRAPELYVTYYCSMEPGPFPISSPCVWAKTDADTLKTVLQAVLSNPAAHRVYVRILLAAKNKEGQPVFPAARVDLLLGMRVATEIPEGHPARRFAPIKNKAPLLFYEERDDGA